MKELKVKNNFDNIWNILVEADTKSGFFLLKAPPEKKTLLQWIYKLTMPRNAIFYQGIIITTLITKDFKLISVIFCALIEFDLIAFYISFTNCIFNQKTMRDLLAWCEGLYNVEKKFHRLVQNLAEAHLMSIEKKTTKALKIFRTLMFTACFNVTIGWLVLNIILPESIIPKFTPPAPFYLPFKNKDNWTAYLVTLGVQAMIIFDGVTMIVYVNIVLFTVVSHILSYLDLILQVAKHFKQEMKFQFKSPVNVTKKSRSRLDPAILESIDESLNDENNNNNNNNNEESFDEWIKIITEMISDVSLIISSFSKFYSKTFLSVEATTLASLFVTGLIFSVLHQQYAFAVGLTFSTLILWIVCYTNEKIFEKFTDIKAALYDIPWYDLEVKQQKTFLIALNCDEIQKGLTAAGIHNLTIERFGIVVKAGYTNLLVLKDLVQK